MLGCLHLARKSCALSNVSFENTISCTRCQRVVENPAYGYNVVDSLADWPGYGGDVADSVSPADSKK